MSAKRFLHISTKQTSLSVITFLSTAMAALGATELLSVEKSCRAKFDQLTAGKAPDAQVAKAAQELAGVLVEEGRAAEAEPLYNRYRDNDKQIRKNIFIDIVLDAQLGTARDVYAGSFKGTTDLSKAITDANARLDPNSAKYAEFLENVAFAYPCFPTKTQPLIPIIVQAMQIRQRLDGEDSPAVAHDKFMIAYRLAALGGNYMPPALESYNIWKKLSEKKDVRLKSVGFQPTILRLGYLLAGNEQTRPKALELANLALANYLALTPNGDLSLTPIHVREKYGLGVLYENLGEYAKAQAAYETAFGFYNSHKMPDEAARMLIARARIDQLSGDYDTAWKKATWIEDLCQKTWGANFYQVNKTGMAGLEVITSIARSKGDLATAEKYARQLTLKTNFPQTDTQVARHYLELAQVLSLNKNDEEAARHAHKAVEVLSLLPQPTYFEEGELAKAHLILAKLALAKADYKLADSEYRQSLNSQLKDKSSAGLLGLVAIYNGLSLTSSRLGDTSAADKNVFAACENLDKYISSGFAKLSFAGQCAFIQYVSDQINPLLSLGSVTDSCDKRFQYAMRWQGLLIDAVKRQSNVERNGDPNTVSVLRNIRQELSELSAGAPGKTDDVTGIQTRTLMKEMLERKLALRAAPAAIDPMLSMTSNQFSNSLANDEVLIDILRFKDALNSKQSYFVFTISKKNGVKGFRLGDADDIDKSSLDWLHAMASNSGAKRDLSLAEDETSSNTKRIDCTELAIIVNKKIWQPIRSTIPSGIHKVWICPDSQLATLPWSVLIDSSEGNHFSTSQIDSPRALSQLKTTRPTTQAQDLLVIGGIKFAKESLFLPGTESEAEEIATLASPTKMRVTKLTERQPTKEIVLKHLNTATYAHLATHGFFDEGDLAKDTKSGTVSIDMKTAAAARNPLVLSGLLIAPKPESEKLKGTAKLNYLNVLFTSDNDRLTAEELVGQDMSHCNLVVLSACNTGRGRDYEGQGVMGLRAALVGAGSRGVLMSLWSVDDRATKELMKYFYQNLWSTTKPMKPVEALRSAQNSVRSAPGGEWQHPFYWAGWAFDGDGW